MKTKKTSAAKVFGIIFLILTILAGATLVTLNLIRDNTVNITETHINFGQAFANENIELFRDGTPVMSRTLDANGGLVATGIEPGSYYWKIDNLEKTGSIEVKSSQKPSQKAVIQEKATELSHAIYAEYKWDLLALGVGVVSLLILLHIIFASIGKKLRKRSNANGNFCPQCGLPFANIPTDKMYCNVCKQKIPMGSHFCTNCGIAFNHSVTQQNTTTTDTPVAENIPEENATDNQIV